MSDKSCYEYIGKMARVSDLHRKAEMMLLGSVNFFPFQRATLFTYSPLNYSGEGAIEAKAGKTVPFKKNILDIRSIHSLHRALTQNLPLIADGSEFAQAFPDAYSYQPLKTSVAIIPISLLNIVVSFVLLDQNKGHEPFNITELPFLSYYFTFPFQPATELNILSKRETEVLQYLANGYSNKEIAALFSVSEFTVRDHVSSAVRKLGVKHRTEAVAAGMRRGIIL
jgi:DNA-binding CsgD family transcriptional regulator